LSFHAATYILFIRGNIMKKTILALTFATVSISAFAGFHPIARTAVVATSDHPVAMAAATSGHGAHPVARGAAVMSSDHPAEMAVATSGGAHPVARTAVVAGSDHPLAAAAVTAH
jgi:hypothetical protein